MCSPDLLNTIDAPRLLPRETEDILQFLLRVHAFLREADAVPRFARHADPHFGGEGIGPTTGVDDGRTAEVSSRRGETHVVAVRSEHHSGSWSQSCSLGGRTSHTIDSLLSASTWRAWRALTDWTCRHSVPRRPTRPEWGSRRPRPACRQTWRGGEGRDVRELDQLIEDKEGGRGGICWRGRAGERRGGREPPSIRQAGWRWRPWATRWARRGLAHGEAENEGVRKS